MVLHWCFNFHCSGKPNIFEMFIDHWFMTVSLFFPHSLLLIFHIAAICEFPDDPDEFHILWMVIILWGIDLSTFSYLSCFITFYNVFLWYRTFLFCCNCIFQSDFVFCIYFKKCPCIYCNNFLPNILKFCFEYICF